MAYKKGETPQLKFASRPALKDLANTVSQAKLQVSLQKQYQDSD